MKFLVAHLFFLFFVNGLYCQNDELQLSILAGETIYKKKCAACHGKLGEGKAERIPPLANSDYLSDNLLESIRGILFGQQGEITVNGVIYNKKMKAIKLTDQEVADVMNFVLNSWGNKTKELLTKGQVAQIKKKG